MFDLTATDSSLKGVRGGRCDDTCGYVLPGYIGAYFGEVARLNLNAVGNIEVLDLTATDSSLKGFRGGIGDKVARFNPKASGNVEVLDLMATDCSLKGVRGGFSVGTHGYRA